MTDESPLEHGRVTEGVVRVGDTVRRPAKANSVFVRALLAHLNERGFEASPRQLGADERGREIFSYLPGEVPAELEPNIADDTLVAAARLIRRYHDATAGSTLAAGEETVCHNDLSPCNFVFRGSTPIGIIDFDLASPGRRVDDVGYAIFLWLNLGTDGPPPSEQRRRIEVFCNAYGIVAGGPLVDAVVEVVATNVDRLRAQGRVADSRWWQQQHDWLAAHRVELEA